MKLIILIMLALSVVTTCFKPVRADIEINAKHLSDTTGNDHYALNSWRGIEVKYQADKDSLYYFVSHDSAKVVMKAPAFDIEFIGIGFGFKKPVTSSVNIYGQIGYYFVNTSVEGRFDCPKFSCGEGLYYGLNDMWSSTHAYGLVEFDEYEIDPQDGYGITLGLELTRPLTKNTNLIFGAEYRALSYIIGVHGMSKDRFGDYDINGQRWETVFKGTNSTNFNVGLSYSF